MSENLQELVLHYIIQTGSTEVIGHLRKSMFEHPDHAKIFEAIESHLKLYNEVPNIPIILEYGDSTETEWYDACTRFLTPLNSPEYVAAKLNHFIKTGQFRDLMDKVVPEIKDGKDVYGELLSQFEAIASIDVGNTKLSGDFIEDSEIDFDFKEGHPTFLPALNKMTAAGGFYSPQLIVFLGGPKTFKTGFLINLGVNYAYDGMKVFFADFENGQEELKRRVQQCICRSTVDDLYSNEMRDEYKDQKEIINEAGGKFYIKSFTPRVDGMRTLDAEIAAISQEKGWIPDILIIDYLDIMGSDIKGGDHERRHIIQSNYMGAVGLNKKYGMFTFSVSKAKQSAFKKKSLDEEDFAEDSEKVYNTHAAFGFMRDATDHQFHRARIKPIVQRSGVSRGKDDCWIEIDEEKQMVIELDPSIK